MPHVPCNKCREQTVFNGSVGQGISLSVRDHVQAFHVNNPPWFTLHSLTLSLISSWSIRPISYLWSAWQSACFLVLVITVKKCVFIPFFFPQPLLILSRLPAIPSPQCFFSQPPFDSVILCLGRLLCLCTLSTTGFWKTAVPCLPLASNAEARALPREGDQVWLCRHAHSGHKGAGRVMLRSVSSVWGRLL